MALVGTLVAGALVGLLAERLNVPGGLILGSFAGDLKKIAVPALLAGQGP